MTAIITAAGAANQDRQVSGRTMPPSPNRSPRVSTSPPEVQKVRLVASQTRRTLGEIRIRRWSPTGRVLRAAKALGACWGLAVVSVLIPAAHFILVPAFLLAGPVAACVVGRQQGTVLGGDSTCPVCAAPFPITGGPEEWPLRDVCPRCRAPVTIERDF